MDFLFLLHLASFAKAVFVMDRLQSSKIYVHFSWDDIYLQRKIKNMNIQCVAAH